MTDSHFLLQKEIEGITALLDKFRIETHLVEASASRQQDLEHTVLKKQQSADLERHLKRFHAADLAVLLEVLPTEDRHLVWASIPIRRRGDVFLELAEPVLESIVSVMSHEDLVAALRELDADDLIYLNEEVPSAAFHEALQALSKEDRSWVHTAITYPEESVGHLMDSELFVIRPEQSLDDVLSQYSKALMMCCPNYECSVNCLHIPTSCSSPINAVIFVAHYCYRIFCSIAQLR